MTSLFGKLQVTASDFKIGIADALLVYAFLCYTEKTLSSWRVAVYFSAFIIKVKKHVMHYMFFLSESQNFDLKAQANSRNDQGIVFLVK